MPVAVDSAPPRSQQPASSRARDSRDVVDLPLGATARRSPAAGRRDPEHGERPARSRGRRRSYGRAALTAWRCEAARAAAGHRRRWPSAGQPAAPDAVAGGHRQRRGSRIASAAMDDTARDGAPQTLLITLSGKDRPGVTSAVFDTLSGAGVEVLDIEQIVLRRRLVLGVLVTAPRDWKKLRAAVEATAAALGMSVDVDRGVGDNKAREQGRSHVTVIGTPLKASQMAAVAGRIADSGANIDRIERMARYPVTAIDLHVSGADPDQLRTLLAAEAADPGHRRGRPAGQPDAPRHAADRARRRLDAGAGRGDRDARRARRRRPRRSRASPRRRWRASSTSRSRCARGSRCSRASTPPRSTRCTTTWCSRPGARTMVRVLRRLGYRFALVSGGFSQITDRLAEELGIHYSHANELEVVDGRLTGRIVGDVVDRAGKADGAAPVRRGGRRTARRGHRHRRRRQRPRHARGRRARDRLQRQAGRPATPPTPRSTCRTSTRSCTSSASPARRSRRPTPRPASPPPLPRSSQPASRTAPVRSAAGRPPAGRSPSRGRPSRRRARTRRPRRAGSRWWPARRPRPGSPSPSSSSWAIEPTVGLWPTTASVRGLGRRLADQVEGRLRLGGVQRLAPRRARRPSPRRGRAPPRSRPPGAPTTPGRGRGRGRGRPATTPRPRPRGRRRRSATARRRWRPPCPARAWRMTRRRRGCTGPLSQPLASVSCQPDRS